MIPKEQSQSRTNFENWVLITIAVLIGVIAVTIILRELYFGSNAQLITLSGSGSFLALLVIPIITGYMTGRFNAREMKYQSAPRSIRDIFNQSLRRCNFMLILAASLIPAVVVFCVFMQLYIPAVFVGIQTCYPGEGCGSIPVPPLPRDLPVQTLFVLCICMGLWGINLLAMVVSSAITFRSGHVSAATLGALFVVVVTTFVVIALPSAVPGVPASSEMQGKLVILASLLPYGLALLVYLALNLIETQDEETQEATS